MLREIGSYNVSFAECNVPKVQTSYERNELDDLKKAIELLYEFKKKLSELHPNCLNVIDHMLRQPRF